MDENNSNVMPATDRGWSDRTHAAIGWSLLAAAALLVFYGTVLSRWLPLPRSVGFRLFILTFLIMSGLWWNTAHRRLARHVADARWSRGLRLAVGVITLALNVPMVVMLMSGRMPAFLATFPTWYAAAFAIWHMGLLVLMPIAAGLRLAVLGLAALARRLAAARNGERPVEQGALDGGGAASVDAGRRAFLRTAVVTVPLAGLGAATLASGAQERRLAVRRHLLRAPWLPDRLRGLTLTHVSDLHVGRHYRPDMLGRLVDEVNRLKSDIVVVTGDVVDVSNDMLPPAIAALRQFEHRHGLFNCIGNHDEIDDRAAFIREMRRYFPLLINQRETVVIGGERLCMAGLDFSRGEEAQGRRRGHAGDAHVTLSGYDAAREGPVIALAHHPHAFDALAARGVPLTLSGHTHGGQIMFTSPGSGNDLGAGRLLFRYVRGWYASGGSKLFVNSGVGNWFPLRVFAPAEVVQIQIV